MHGPGRDKRFLVILDDEPKWCELYRRFLDGHPELSGISIETFVTDEEAERFIREHSHEIAGIIQDMNRGADHGYTQDRDGVRFLNEVVWRYTPTTRTLIVSGGIRTQTVRDLLYGTQDSLDRINVLFKGTLDIDQLTEMVPWLIRTRAYEQTAALETPVLWTPALKVIDLPWDDITHCLARHPQQLYNMPPRAFEALVAELFRSHGWNVELTAQTADGGYDIIAIRQNYPTTTRALIEAKRYAPDRPVGVSIVRSLYAVKSLAHASQVILATSSRVSAAAKKEFATVVPWELDFLEGDKILDWCRRYHVVDTGSAPSRVRSGTTQGAS